MRMRKKQNLPSKLCACCGLPFTWRKKWARDWEAVKFCSDRCRQQGAVNGSQATGGQAQTTQHKSPIRIKNK